MPDRIAQALIRIAAAARSRATGTVSVAGVPASLGTIGPVSIAIATPVSERGATPYGRPMHQAASRVTPSQPKLTSGLKMSRLKRTMPAACSSSEFCG